MPVKIVLEGVMPEYLKPEPHIKGIETLFGCLKSRGFDFEETHLTKRTRIERLMFLLSLAICLAIKTGEIKTNGKPPPMPDSCHAKGVPAVPSECVFVCRKSGMRDFAKHFTFRQ